MTGSNPFARVVVFGSINTDVVVPVPRLPIAGETLLGGDAAILPGGKGANQAHAARLAGVAVAMVGRVGQDELAGPALSMLEASGVDLGAVRPSRRATGCAMIWSGPDGSSTIVVSPGANQDINADDVPEALVGPDTVLVLQQEVPLAENARLAARARERGATILLNMAPAQVPDRETLDALDYLIVNDIELAMIAAALGIAGADPAERLARAIGAKVLSTHGEAGAALTDGETTIRQPGRTVDVVDTTGAGDTFTGVFAACLVRGLDEAAALAHANAAAAHCCTRQGAQTAQVGWDVFAKDV